MPLKNRVIMHKKHWFLTLLATILLLAGVHPSPFPWISWFGFLPFFLILWDPSCKKLHLVTYTLVSCFLYYGIGLSWLVHFNLLVYFLALAVITPFFLIYFLPLRLLCERWPAALKIFASVLWSALLYKAYAVSPLGSVVIEVPFYAPLPFLQIASVTGFILLPALGMGINASIALFISHRSKAAAFGILLFVAGLLAIFIWGTSELKKTYPTPLHWTILQHNLPISGGWQLEHSFEVMDKYRAMALQAARKKPAMIIFPLYNFPEDVLRHPEFFTDLARRTKAWILVATYIPLEEGQDLSQGFFDTALLYSPDGRLVDHTQAVRPPPFRQISESNQKGYKVLSTPFGKIGILLCYEDCLPAMAQEAVRQGADMLIALSNPGYFTSTWMPYYHLMQDRLRAIESKCFVVRVSANGYSGVVDPQGRVLQKSHLSQEEILQIQVGKVNP